MDGWVDGNRKGKSLPYVYWKKAKIMRFGSIASKNFRCIKGKVSKTNPENTTYIYILPTHILISSGKILKPPTSKTVSSRVGWEEREVRPFLSHGTRNITGPGSSVNPRAVCEKTPAGLGDLKTSVLSNWRLRSKCWKTTHQRLCRQIMSLVIGTLGKEETRLTQKLALDNLFSTTGSVMLM